MAEITEKVLRNVALETPDNFQRVGRMIMSFAGDSKSEILGLELGEIETADDNILKFSQWERRNPITVRRVYDFGDGSYQLTRISQPTRGKHYGQYRSYLFGNDGRAITGLSYQSIEILPKRQIDNNNPAIILPLLGRIASKPTRSNVNRSHFRWPSYSTKVDFAEEVRSIIPNLGDLMRRH